MERKEGGGEREIGQETDTKQKHQYTQGLNASLLVQELTACGEPKKKSNIAIEQAKGRFVLLFNLFFETA